MEYSLGLQANVERQCVVSGRQYDGVQHDGEHDLVSIQVRGELHVEWLGVRSKYQNLHVCGKAKRQHCLEHRVELYTNVERQCVVPGRQHDGVQHDGEHDIVSIQVRGRL
jgi:hypothetical protein